MKVYRFRLREWQVFTIRLIYSVVIIELLKLVKESVNMMDYIWIVITAVVIWLVTYLTSKSMRREEIKKIMDDITKKTTDKEEEFKHIRKKMLDGLDSLKKDAIYYRELTHNRNNLDKIHLQMGKYINKFDRFISDVKKHFEKICY